MNEVFFVVLAFLTVFLSIKLSYYADLLSKTSNVSKALIGGIVLAGITSLPEFVTCFSAIFIDNPILAMGDILGSNLFNIFMVCFFDIVFMNKMVLKRVSKKHSLVYVLLLVNYFFVYLYIKSIINISFFNVGIPSFIIIITYLYYLKKMSVDEGEKILVNKSRNINNAALKLFLTAIFMVVSSVLLTIVVNKIAILNPEFSGSVIGAILLGITTSLPEVITFYTLVTLNSHDLALANIVGSNLFNLLVLAVADVFVRSFSIYDFSDHDNLVILLLGCLFTFINLIQIRRKRIVNNYFYIIPSCIVVIIYFGFWINHFIMG